MNLFKLIDTPTRETNLLDLLITDSLTHFYDSGVLPPLPGLDHSVIYGKYIFTYSSYPNYTQTIWDYDTAKYDLLNEAIRNDIYVDDNIEINRTTIDFTNSLIKLIKTHVPHKEITIRCKDKPWFTKSIKIKYKQCIKLHKLKNMTQNPIHIEQYRQKRIEAKTAFREARKSYYNNLSSKLLDPLTTSKIFWKLVRSVFSNNNKQNNIPTLIDNNITYTNNQDKAELLNNYFVSQTILPSTNIPLPPFYYITDARLDQITITPSDVRDVLLQLDTSKAVGPDRISNKILKSCADSLCNPLTHLLWKSLNIGVFPDLWKESYIRMCPLNVPINDK